MAVGRPGHGSPPAPAGHPGKSLSPPSVCMWEGAGGGPLSPPCVCAWKVGETTPGVLPALGSHGCEQCPREASVTITWATFTVRSKGRRPWCGTRAQRQVQGGAYEYVLLFMLFLKLNFTCVPTVSIHYFYTHKTT